MDVALLAACCIGGESGGWGGRLRGRRLASHRRLRMDPFPLHAEAELPRPLSPPFLLRLLRRESTPMPHWASAICGGVCRAPALPAPCTSLPTSLTPGRHPPSIPASATPSVISPGSVITPAVREEKKGTAVPSPHDTRKSCAADVRATAAVYSGWCRPPGPIGPPARGHTIYTPLPRGPPCVASSYSPP